MAEEKVLVNFSDVAKRQRHYETVFILSPALSDAQATEIITRVTKSLTDAGAAMLRQDNWGKKRMAYMINKHGMGNYYYYRYVATQEAVKAFERLLKLDAGVLRLMTIKLSEPLSADAIKALVEKAPREPSQAPSIRQDFEEPAFESAL